MSFSCSVNKEKEQKSKAFRDDLDNGLMGKKKGSIETFGVNNACHVGGLIRKLFTECKLD